jgi:hypothetical protein
MQLSAKGAGRSIPALLTHARGSLGAHAADRSSCDGRNDVNAARPLKTEEAPAPVENSADTGRDADAFSPPHPSAALLAASISILILPIPFIFTHGPVWATLQLLPLLRTAGWVALAFNTGALVLCGVSKPLRTPIGVLTYRLAFLYGGIAWLSGLVITYLSWGLGAVIAGIVCLGGGVVTTGLLATLTSGEWKGFLPLLVFVVLTFASRTAGIRLARHGMQYRR